jgi:hypothetical protein
VAEAGAALRPPGGDTVWYVQACRKAGVPCIGLLSGGISGDELTAAGVAEVYPGPADLLATLRGSLLGRNDAGQPDRSASQRSGPQTGS